MEFAVERARSYIVAIVNGGLGVLSLETLTEDCNFCAADFASFAVLA